MPEPLAFTEAYGPYIHAGTQNWPGKREMRHCPGSTWGMYAVADGEMLLSGAEKTWQIAAPATALLPPAGEKKIEVTAACEWYFLQFDMLYAPRRHVAEGKHAMTHAGKPRLCTPEQLWGVTLPDRLPLPLMRSGLDTIRSCCGSWWRDVSHYMRANAMLGMWLSDVVQHLLLEQDVLDDPWLRACRRIAERRLEYGLTVEQWARALGMSRGAFIKRFATVSRLPPGRYLREMRLERACHWMRVTKWPLAGVARAVGYRSLPAFINAFKSSFGCAPSAWRRKPREED
jgi:AraC-like DNA-binding protein